MLQFVNIAVLYAVGSVEGTMCSVVEIQLFPTSDFLGSAVMRVNYKSRKSQLEGCMSVCISLMMVMVMIV